MTARILRGIAALSLAIFFATGCTATKYAMQCVSSRIGAGTEANLTANRVDAVVPAEAVVQPATHSVSASEIHPRSAVVRFTASSADLRLRTTRREVISPTCVQ